MMSVESANGQQSNTLLFIQWPTPPAESQLSAVFTDMGLLGVLALAAILFSSQSCIVSAGLGKNRSGSDEIAKGPQRHSQCFSSVRVGGSSDENPLWTFFQTRDRGPGIHKWLQYFDVYHRYFSRFIDTEVHLLEIGVQSGGSLDMWRHYFGDRLRIYGVDINPYTKALFEDLPGTQIFIGDQENRTFWAEVKSRVPRIDIVLDDGGHTYQQQLVTFEELYDFVSDNGVYMIEDVTTTGPGTYVGYAQQHISDIYGHYTGSAAKFTTTTVSVAFYDQQVVYEKGSHPRPPEAIKKGKFWMPYISLTHADGSVRDDHLQNFQEELKNSWT
ncbi:hypothetical protein COCSUDRAFT_31870 [Coccomyxa subellipsoidea C-169]|uniref:S-adenosyl-L-methionine-dependent methyltransferase n=1 Tax=Coccomyxa subellipsoidea (strain C-169) TaxID=574566 RepID=I0YI87_COCSC|nr:hypothetical protein COCSUDRAFT_31870 [Coccomyxa subellipsoidea C-169]EIE18106.1 hypothetical protein COCSUDRAFT_31870 [Coccomyxa subellipsoidea C-169]|eukprot:XP_005642650.1 hypothetical protein COCSUDRAFT_31870 [Coccomyxa subellipsoidea C-169]